MSSPAEAVQALYRALGSWQRVADTCNDDTEVCHSAGYYQQVATRRIRKPSEATRAGITRALVSAERLLKRRLAREARGGLAVRLTTRERLRSVKDANGWTWDETLQSAAELMEGER